MNVPKLLAFAGNLAVAWGAFTVYYWVFGPELSKLEAMGLCVTGALIGQFWPLVLDRARR